MIAFPINMMNALTLALLCCLLYYQGVVNTDGHHWHSEQRLAAARFGRSRVLDELRRFAVRLPTQARLQYTYPRELYTLHGCTSYPTVCN